MGFSTPREAHHAIKTIFWCDAQTAHSIRSQASTEHSIKRQLLEIIKGLVEFPFAQIFRHHAAMKVADVIDEPELVDALCKSSRGDSEALESPKKKNTT